MRDSGRNRSASVKDKINKWESQKAKKHVYDDKYWERGKKKEKVYRQYKNGKVSKKVLYTKKKEDKSEYPQEMIYPYHMNGGNE